ncbi:MAG: hypothetical protein AVDCRST_MAG04-2660, partial [uncultured Acetobacteraceae bacterium]
EHRSRPLAFDADGAAAAGRGGEHAGVPGDDAELQPGDPGARRRHALRPAAARRSSGAGRTDPRQGTRPRSYRARRIRERRGCCEAPAALALVPQGRTTPPARLRPAHDDGVDLARESARL